MRDGGSRLRAACALLWTALVVLCVAAPAASAGPFKAPSPGGSERRAVAVPPPKAPEKRFFGYHEYAYEHNEHGWDAQDVARISAGAGANVLRFTIDWMVVEPTRDIWSEPDWDYFERIYDAALARDIRPHITVSTAPPWAREGLLAQLCGPNARPCEYPPARTTAMNAEWQEFTREVARRFPAAAAIEIWNEPNLAQYYKPYPNPARYAELVALAYPAIKSVAPRVNVLAGANAPAQDFEYDTFGNKVKWPIEDFMRAAYSANPSIKNKMDGISYHYLWPSRQFGKDSRFADLVRDVRKVRNEFGDRKLGLWMSEFGLTTTGPQAATPAQQSDALIRLYRRLMTMKDSRELIVHTLADRVELPASDKAYGFGLIASFDPFVPKPAFCAFAGRTGRKNPFGPCSRVREGLIPITRCTRRLVRVEKGLRRAGGSRRSQLRRQYSRVASRCVPCDRRIAILERKVARLKPGQLRSRLIARKAKVESQCAPCRRKLHRAAAAAAVAGIVDAPSKLETYERKRRRCRA